MAQYYQIQNLDELKQIYADVQVVHVASDDVGVSNPNRAQQVVLDETQEILLQNDGPQQVVYQTQGTPTQYQPPQAGTHYTILGEDMNQPQAQQQSVQQHQQVVQQQQTQQPQQHQQQVLMHQQQQHQVMDHQQQQHQLQTAYQLSQEAQQPQQQQHIQSQEHQIQQQQQQHVQAQPQQLFYTTDPIVHQQQQQKKVYIQQQPLQQQQYQTHPQQHQQQLLHQPPPPQQQPQQQQQQHILQSPHHQQQQQVQVQHQVSPSHQQTPQQQQPQIIYRMQPQPTQQLLVQQPSGQHVLIQQQPQQQQQQQELIMRQSMPQPRIIYNNRLVYSTPQQQSPQAQQQTLMAQSPQTHQQQQHIQLQTNAMHHNQTHLVQQARVVPTQHQQQQQSSSPNQQMQQNVVFQQIQVQQNNQIPKTIMQQQQQPISPQHQQHLQLQHQQQQQQQQQAHIVGQPTNPNGTTIIRGIAARGAKLGRGQMNSTMIARMPGLPGIRADIRPACNAAGALGGGAGQILRTPRPRCSTTAGSTPRGRGRGSRGAAAAAAAAAAAGRGTSLLAPNPQIGTLQQGKVVTQSLPTPGGTRQVFRTQITDGNSGVQQQQLHLVHAQPRMTGGVTRFRSPALGVQQQQQQQQAVQQQNNQQPTTSNATNASGGNYELDLEDSIQAVFVKKDAQNNKVPSLPNQTTSNAPVPNSSNAQMGNTTLTTFYAAATTKDDDDNRMIRTQNGTCMSLAEYKKRNSNVAAGQIIQTSTSSTAVAAGLKPLQQTAAGAKISLPATGPSVHTVPVARVAPQKHIVNKDPGGGIGGNGAAGGVNSSNSTTTCATTQLASGPPAGSSVYQTSHNNYEIQTQHVLQNRAGQQMAEKDRNSAKMLVILVSGEQRLITFTLPRESCTVQDLLEQVGVPFDNTTTIQCVENPGANIDFVVTVGFSVQESASELISRAEQSLQISRQQESLQQNPATLAPPVNTSSNEGAPQNNNATAVAAAAVAASTSSAAAAAGITTAENTTKETASNAAKLAANAAATSATSSSKVTEELPHRKLIQGFYAICQSCGFSGYDHAKCERCKRVFMEPPKKIPIKQATASSLANNFTSSSNTSGSSESSSSSTLPIDKKRHPETVGPRGGKSSLPYNPNATSTRGRGGSQTGRGRGSRAGRRAAEIEPVILTLSSDEEDDESSNQGKSNMSASVNTSANTSSNIGLTTYKPFSFEPNIPETDETTLYNDFTRGDVTDLTNCADKLSCNITCKLIRMGTYRFEPVEQVTITSQGVRIVAPLETDPSETFALNIYKHEVVKIIAHFSKNTTGDSMLCFYTLRNCAKYIRNSLKMPEIGAPLDGVTYFSASGPYQERKIILQFNDISERARSVIRSIWDFLDEISDTDAQDLLQRAATSDLKLVHNKNSDAVSTTTQIQPNEIIQLLIYPPGKGGISINTEDYMCLATDQYLNDIIIDFYLKWVHDNVIPETQKERTHIFSTFFYKRLTTLTRHTHQDKDVKQTAAQKRHARVQNWTKNVNIFDKDFIVIPINEQSHWFLAIICFPRLKGPVTFDTHAPVELQPIKKTKGKKVSLQIGNTTITPLSKRDSANVLSEICGVGDEDSERDEAEGDESDLASEDSDFDNSSTNTVNNSQTVAPVLPGTTISSTHQPIKQPLILIFDSLAGASRSRVVATLRDYLTCEYKIKMPEAPHHSFNKDNMPGHCVKVPQQNNFTDCGLYLLQYVEHFFKDPIRDYRVPIKQLAQWFDTLTVTRKREDISFLLQNLMNERNGPNNKVILPEIPFPTLNGQLVEPDGYNIEFEEEEMEDDEEDENTTGDMEELSTDDTSKSKTPIKMPISNTGVASTTTSTAAALVPTQGRKIVVKRRMQISGNSETNSPQSNAAAANTTSCVAPPTAGHLRSSMTKIRKVEP